MSSETTQPKLSSWGHARRLAEQTPESRNRYVDFLRAASILAVVTGHWLIAAPWIQDGQLRLDHMLALAPWTRWLSWVFQVMPIFFMVGGFSNSVSWESAQKRGQAYGLWVATRLRRLVGPVVPLLVFWAVLAAIAHQLGTSPEVIKIGSQAALVPVWFLAVYVLVVVLTPVSSGLWRRFGMSSIWGLVACAVIIDLVRFKTPFVGAGWANYLFVWSAVHQLGYAWRAGRLSGPARTLPWLLGGSAMLVGLVKLAGYPQSMVGVPGEEVSNTLPPSLAMLALGAAQAGLLLTIEAPARRALRGVRTWATVILVNGMIMSVYLWHLTAMVLMIGLANLLGGVGLHLVPGSAVWWATRPVWMAVFGVALFLLLLPFGRFERLAEPKTPLRLPLWRAVAGTAMICGGLALVAMHGVGGDGLLGLRLWVLLLALVGAAMVGAVPLPWRRVARSGG